MDSSEYYWLPWLHIYQKLQAATRTGTSSLDAELKQVHQWLQEGAARFKPPSEQSAAAIKKGGNLKASAYGPGKGFAIDKQLVQATLELSPLLVSQYLSASSISVSNSSTVPVDCKADTRHSSPIAGVHCYCVPCTSTLSTILSQQHNRWPCTQASTLPRARHRRPVCTPIPAPTTNYVCRP
jgi:hypothetical protein